MSIFKYHQLELRIQRSHRSIPFEDILEIRDQGLVFLVEMGIPVVLFKKRLTLEKQVRYRENRGIQFPVIVIKGPGKTPDSGAFTGTVRAGQDKVRQRPGSGKG